MKKSGLNIDRMKANFLKGFEITYQSIFWSARPGNINKSVKKNKEKYGKIENFFFSASDLNIGRM